MPENRLITQVCIVVHDVKKVSANWAKILGTPEAKIETISLEGIHHYTQTNQQTTKIAGLSNIS